ncbi:P-selectin-like isoform X2 [Stegostoma tigrinum]|nr:P-selectin-like isoform X2 [Stegostoma tigrinum]
MTWPDARNYCQHFFTDLVAIQNHEEIDHLNTVIPRNPTYYWIGIRKINNAWTWVGTNKTLDEEAENWAAGEPTPGAEDCVEIYIKRTEDAGRWNNDPCLERSKRALCYLASCKSNSCSGHGQCVETIGSYTCQCYEGFYGPKCQSAVKCEIPKIPRNGTSTCSHPIGNFSYRSSCDFGCVEGFLLNGSATLQCEASGTWSSSFPTCEAVKCEIPKIPRNGTSTCSHPIGNFSYRSNCDFGCVEGFLLNGSATLQCEASGMWSSSFPTCEVEQCTTLNVPDQATMSCTHPNGNFSFNSTCDFHCAAGFTLQGSQRLQCNATGMWTVIAPYCAGTLKEYNSTKLISICVGSSVCLISVLSAVILCQKKVMRKGFSPIST